MITFSKRAYIGLLNLASKEEFRYYLNGVCVTKHPEKGVILAATDGHLLGVVHDVNGVWEDDRKEVIVRTSMPLVRAATAAKDLETIVLDGDDATIDDITLRKSVIDGTYPDWRRVIPDGETKPVGAIGLNISYAARFAKAAKDMQIDAGATFYMKDPASPVVLVFPTATLRFFGVWMPMRIDEKAKPIPDWLAAPQAPKQAAE